MSVPLDSRHQKLIKDGDRLYTDRHNLDSFWQEAAMHFHPEMAEFTRERPLGEEFAAHLTTSYPLIARRTLGDSLSALLRPVTLDTTSPGVWFSIRAMDDRREDQPALRWLEWATGVMRRAMYDRVAQFLKATKTGDHSFVTFGQCPLQLTLSRFRDALLYQCWHLRDVVWSEDGQGAINHVQRKWNACASDVALLFGRNCAPQIDKLLSDDPYAKVECRHVVLSRENYEQRDPKGRRYRKPWVSVWIDVTHGHCIEEVNSDSRGYIIPRWITIPGCQYASSPAVTAALPDARLMQAVSLTLIDASEKFADPPMAAVQEALRSPANLFPGGITYLDAEYDERLGEALRPIYQPNGAQNLQAGFNVRADARDMIAKAFYLDSLSLPPIDNAREMTAFEVGQRMSEWLRRAMPIFEPIEYEYNALLCEETFDMLLRNGAFGSIDDMPQSLRGAEIKFKFESPLHESSDRRKGQKFMEASAALVQAAQLDPTVSTMLDAQATLRDVLVSIGCPPTWVRSPEEQAVLAEQQNADMAAQQALAGGQAGSEMIANLAGAAKDFNSSQTPAAAA